MELTPSSQILLASRLRSSERELTRARGLHMYRMKRIFKYEPDAELCLRKDVLVAVLSLFF